MAMGAVQGQALVNAAIARPEPHLPTDTRGNPSVSDGGSFTLTSGVLDRDPIRMGTGAAAVNGALGGFVLGAAIEIPRGLRINVVSPGLLDVSVPRYGEWFPGHESVSSKRVGLAYAKSVEGAITGKVIIVQ